MAMGWIYALETTTCLAHKQTESLVIPAFARNLLLSQKVAKVGDGILVVANELLLGLLAIVLLAISIARYIRQHIRDLPI